MKTDALVGYWQIHQADSSTPEFYTSVYLRFTATNILEWGWEQEKNDALYNQAIINEFQYRLEDSLIGTLVPPNPRQEFTPYQITPEGRLRLDYGYHSTLWIKAEEPAFFSYQGKNRYDIEPNKVRPDYWKNRHISPEIYHQRLRRYGIKDIDVPFQLMMNAYILWDMVRYTYCPFTTFPLEDFRSVLEEGALVGMSDNMEETLLIALSGEGEFEAVKLLLQSGANINAKEINGLTALDYARNRNFTEIENYLLASGGVSGLSNK